MSYGYLKKSNIIFSQELSLICANVLIYLETVLLSAKFVSILPMIEMTLIQGVVIAVYSFCMDKLFKKMFPPHKITVLYQEYDPSDMLRKVKARKDRYLIKDVVSVDREWNEIVEIIDRSEAIIFCHT